jgi:transposase
VFKRGMKGVYAMIPTKRNRLIQIPVDGTIYALCNIIERCFNKLKNARRMATRYDKTAISNSGFVHIVSIRLWMKEFVNRS